MLDSVAVLYLGVPALALAAWIPHAVWAWRRPDRPSLFGILLLVGLPVAAVGAFIAFGLTPDRPYGTYEPLPPGDHGDQRLRLLILFAELVMSWFIVLVLELVLLPVRSRRRRRGLST